MDFESETFIAHAFDARQSDVCQYGAVTGPLDTDGQTIGVLAFDTTQVTSAANRSNPQPGDACHPLAAGAHAPAISYSTKLHNTASNNAGKIFEERTAGLDANSPPPALLTASQVRRLTPRECERLQGFAEDYTLVPYGRSIRPEKQEVDWVKYLMRGGRLTFEQCARLAADGPRYKALGNSWAVPCVRWIGERITRRLSEGGPR